MYMQVPIKWDEVEWSKYSPEEAHRLRHRMIEEKHRGHDLMHAEMILILFGAILAAQVLLFLWRQKHRRSYQVGCTRHSTMLPFSLLWHEVWECGHGVWECAVLGGMHACHLASLLDHHHLCHIQSHPEEDQCLHTQVG